MNRACLFSRRVLFVVALGVAAPLCLSPSAPAAAQEGEARLLFERGNQHLAAGMRARGRRRTRELEQALDAYLGVLRLGGRTRNVVFNLALTVQELGREREAFNYYSEYLSSFELSEEDRAEGQRRLDAIRPNVAVLEIASDPPGAAVRIDRRDLPVRGTTPVTLAVEPGEHALFFSREGYDEATASATAAVGQSAAVSATLPGQPVSVQFIAPSGGRLTLDGEPVEAGRAIPVPPGSHVVRLDVPGSPPVERTFELSPGGEPLVLELTAASSSQTRLAVTVSTEADVLIDGVPAGSGRSVQLPTSPGEHVLSVRAPGYNTASHRFTLDADQQLSLDVSLGEAADESGLNASRALFGVLSSISVVVAGSLGVFSLLEKSDYDSEYERFQQTGSPPQADLIAQADALDDLLLATDIVFGATAALGVTTFILLIVGAGDGEPSHVNVAAVASSDGGVATVRGAF